MQGNKQAVGIVYTPWSNLKKTKAMEVGQVRGKPWTAPCPVHLLARSRSRRPVVACSASGSWQLAHRDLSAACTPSVTIH